MDEKRRRFVHEYLETLDAAEAGRRIGFTGTAGERRARRMLHEPAVAKAVERGLAARRRRKVLSADRVLEEFARIAFADIRDYASWDGKSVTFLPGDEISDDAAAAIAEIAPVGKLPRIKLHDKKAALNALARYLGLFAPRAETADPKAEREAAAQLRDKLLARIAGLAAGPKPSNGADS
jgi:phage terminase small subunit